MTLPVILATAEHLSGVLTQPCAGSGRPSLGMPLNPEGHEHTGSLPLFGRWKAINDKVK